MNLKFRFIFCALFMGLNLWSQDADEVLLRIDGEPIYVSEFNRIYKKNLNLISNEEEKDLRGYMDLFINYKLKVKQARDMGFDTLAQYKSELLSYKNQLMEPFLKDEEVVEALLEEAYERSLKEVNASHILIRFGQGVQVDTLAAYSKIYEAYDKLESGMSFEDVVLAYSEDKNLEKNKGSLGYFTVFSMVYPFENAVYQTAVGTYSKPFRTKFGYHIVKVNDLRDAQGEVEAAHIMVKGNTDQAKEKIIELYQQLEQGEEFEFLARTQSEDSYSAKKDGNIGRFGTGRMVKEFEEVVFNMEEEGSYSKPFQTSYGWHIAKLLKKYPVKTYDESIEDLSQKIKRSDRSTIVSSSIVHKLKEEYQIEIYKDALEILKKDVAVEDVASLNQIILKVNGEETLQIELYNYLKRRVLNDDLFEEFLNVKVMDYYKNHLAELRPEFAHTYKEYEEGLLLFELLQAKVWDKTKDSIAIENYFNSHQNAYSSASSFEGTIISGKEKKMVQNARKKLLKEVPNEELKLSLNTVDDINVLINEGVFEYTHELVPESFNGAIGVSKVYALDDHFVVLDVKKKNEPQQLALEEVRGRVISDYQEALEEVWIEELRTNYEVQVNTEVLDRLVANEMK